METPRYRPKSYDISLLILASLIIAIVVSIPNHVDHQLLYINHNTDPAATSDSLILPASDPFDLEQLSEKSEAEIRNWYHKMELLSQVYQGLPKARQEIDSIKQAARKRFPATLP